MRLRTARLVLRPIAARDVPALVAGCNDPEVPRFNPIIPVPYTERDARRWLADAPERRRADREREFAITAPPDDELLGVISVQLRPGGSVGYWLRPHARGHGYSAEALRALVEWAETRHGVRDLYLTTHVDNVASQRVAERAGFARSGVVAHDPPFRDGRADAIRFERRDTDVVRPSAQGTPGRTGARPA
jgi:RimJ/RimL family protein N-acetyltransferase